MMREVQGAGEGGYEDAADVGGGRAVDMTSGFFRCVGRRRERIGVWARRPYPEEVYCDGRGATALDCGDEIDWTPTCRLKPYKD